MEISLGFTLVACATWWLAKQIRRRRRGDVMGPFEEIWHPAAHLTRIEILGAGGAQSAEPSAHSAGSRCEVTMVLARSVPEPFDQPIEQAGHGFCDHRVATQQRSIDAC